MRGRPILLTLLATLAIAASAAEAAAQAPPVVSCEGQVVASVKLVVDGHPEFPQTLLSGLDVRPQMPFTREAYRSSFERLIRLGRFEEVAVACSIGPGGADIAFRAVPYHPVSMLLFEGTTGLPAADLEELIRKHFNGLPTVEPELVNQELLNILADNGYLNATSTPRRETYANPDRSTLIFLVEAGPQAKIGKAKIDGENESAIPTARIRERTGLIEGQPYRRGQVQDAMLRIVNELKTKGYYTAAFLGPEDTRASENIYDVTVTLDTGPLVTLAWDKSGDEPPSGDINTFFPLKQENAINRDMLDDSKQRVIGVLRNEGYPDATVDVLGVGEPTDPRWDLKVHVTRGPKHRIDAVQFPAGLHLTPKELDGWLPVHKGDVRSDAKIFGGLARIQAEYRARGYYRMSVVPKYEEAPNRPKNSKEAWDVLKPQIVEGPRGVVTAVRFERSTRAVSDAELLAAMKGVKGQPYLKSTDITDPIVLETLYVNRGYRTASVEIKPDFSADGTQVTRVVAIDEGTQVIVADVQIVGWRDISEKAIREEVILREGLPFGEEARLESQRRLYNLGVFKRVEVDSETPVRAGDQYAHVIVRVDEAPDTTVQFGGGLEAGNKRRAIDTDGNTENRFEFAPRGFFEITRRNVGGRNRALSLFTRLSLTPKDVPNDPLRDGHGYVPSQYRVALTYQEHRAFGTDLDWLFGLASEQAIRATFNFRRNGGNVDFTELLSRRTRATLRYAIDFNRLYNQRYTPDEELAIDRAFSQVRLSTWSFSVVTDHRDDVISPTRGTFLTGDTELAARAIGSEVGYTKTLLQAAVYRSLVDSRRAVLALRGQVGLARGFEREALDPDGLPIIVTELPASVRFFAGGSTTVRGFQLDQLGAPQVLTATGLSLGGNGLVVLNAELRTKILKIFGRDLSTAVFTDSGNVFAKVSDMSLNGLRGTAGYGVRYNSPIGPIRLDVGYKLTRMTFANGQREGRWELHLSFGEIF